MTRLAVALTVATFLASCGHHDAAPSTAAASPTTTPPHQDPSADEIRIMCEGPNDPVVQAVKSHMDPSQVAREIRERVNNTLKTPEGHAFFDSLWADSLPPAAKGTKLAAEATRVGLSSCAFADFWKSP